MNILSASDGSYNIKSYKIKWLEWSIIFLALTVFGTQYVRFNVPITETILPWDFPRIIILFFLLTGFCLGAYVLRNPKDFLLNTLIFLLFSSSMGTLGWSMMDEYCMVFVALALLFLMRFKKLELKKNADFSKHKIWIFSFFALIFILTYGSLIGFLIWEPKAIRFMALFLAVFVFSYALIFYKFELPPIDKTVKKLLICSCIFYFLTLVVGIFIFLFGSTNKLLFTFRGLGDISYVAAMFPGVLTVPLAFYVIGSKNLNYSNIALLSLILCFFCAMLMDTRAGFLIFALCGAILPFAVGVVKTIKYVSAAIIFSVISTTIIIDEPTWILEAFGSLLNVFSVEGGSYALDYYGETYSATKGDIGRYMFVHSAAVGWLDRPFFFFFGAGNYSFYEVLDPYLTQFKIDYDLPNYNRMGIGNSAPRPPAMGAWMAENGILGVLLILINILACLVNQAFILKEGFLHLAHRSKLFLLIPVITLPLWSYFAEFQDNAFLYFMIMPFGFMYLLNKSINNNNI